MLSYLGFDAIATFAEETVGDSRVVGRATLTCLVIAGLLFMAQTYIRALITAPTPSDLAAHPELQGAAYYTAVADRIGDWLHIALALAKGAGAAFSAMVGQAAASRVLLAMGRTSVLPEALTRVSQRSGVPTLGILVAAIGDVVMATWAATQAEGLDHLVSIVDVGALVAFVMLHVSVVGYFWVRRRGADRSPWRHVVFPVVGAAILLLVLVNASRLALVIGLVWFVLGVVVLLVRRDADADLGV